MQTQISTPTTTNDVTVNLATGEAFISQRKAAIEIGIALSSLQKWLIKEQVKYDVKQGLSSEVFKNALTHFSTSAKNRNPTAVALLKHLSLLGNWTLNDVLAFEYTPKSKRDTSGYIYLLQCNEYYKVGVSKTSVEERVKWLETGNPYPISIIFYKRVKNCYRAEANLHHKYQDFNHKNEWFSGFDVDGVVMHMESIK